MHEIKHHYGKNIHILSDSFLLTHLSRLCSQETYQPLINHLITTLYSSMIRTVANQEFPTCSDSVRTRMASTHPREAILTDPVIDPKTQVVSVNLARAGTLPSHICYDALNYFMDPRQVRQDHISIGRTTDELEKVTGSKVSALKMGGAVDDAIILFPDPMGATGSTLVEAIDLYKRRGRPRKFIAIHCIVTPEYIKKIQSAQPDLQVYAIRLDRGLSPAEVLKTEPGLHWDLERGLNEKHYIVPGGGGFGEILNNADA